MTEEQSESEHISPSLEEAIKGIQQADKQSQPLLPRAPYEAFSQRIAEQDTSENIIPAEEQMLAYKYWVDSLLNRFRDGELTSDEVSKTIANFITTKDIQQETLYFGGRTDRLTGLPNRAAFIETLKQAIENGQQFSILLGDIDKFKSINDTYGHHAGDTVLQQMAIRLLSNIRQEPDRKPDGIYSQQQRERKLDMVARYGGEEWIALLQDVTDEEQLLAVAERIRNSFSSTPFTIIDKENRKQEISVTTSIGGTIRSDQSETDLLNAADTNLYEKKNTGRNKVVI